MEIVGSASNIMNYTSMMGHSGDRLGPIFRYPCISGAILALATEWSSSIELDISNLNAKYTSKYYGYIMRLQLQILDADVTVSLLLRIPQAAAILTGCSAIQ